MKGMSVRLVAGVAVAMAPRAASGPGGHGDRRRRAWRGEDSRRRSLVSPILSGLSRTRQRLWFLGQLV